MRALYGAYTGNLYQVRRDSDMTTKDIGVVRPGGYANAAAQDTFCAGTTCKIAIIYDQSPKGNHLTKAPAGQNAPSPDLEADATQLKFTLAGHPVYGIEIDAGMGYRNDRTSGIAIADQPEGEYMITSAKNANGGCCFDYGNAETTNNDDHAGRMEAIYFGFNRQWGYGSGNGPWVMADMEDGLFSGMAPRLNAGDMTVTYDYVTAMIKGEPGHWSIEAGNAQIGNLTTMYDGPRPNGYDPMKKEGAIILGIGGDNSKASAGRFYEGCMTAGYPSNASDAAVQANIVAAGYGK